MVSRADSRSSSDLHGLGVNGYRAACGQPLRAVGVYGGKTWAST